MNELAEANQAYGALTEGFYLAGFTFERAMARTLQLLKDGGWRSVGEGFDDVNAFVRSLALNKFKVLAEQRREFVEHVKELTPEVSNRALAGALGVHHDTIDRDARGGNPPAGIQKRDGTGRGGGGNPPGAANGERAAEIMALLSVSRDTVERWTKDARAAEKKAQQDRAWDLWLDCWSYREIATEIGVDDKTVAAWCAEFAASADFSAPPASRQHFDVWTFAKADGDESGFFGRMPPQVVENLLWFFTEPSDIVVDLFAGSGTTIDVAKAMGRRIWASDLAPYTPNLPIHQHDARSGWPKDAPPKAKLVLLNPAARQIAVATLKSQGKTQEQIAKTVGASRATIARDLSVSSETDKGKTGHDVNDGAVSNETADAPDIIELSATDEARKDKREESRRLIWGLAGGERPRRLCRP